MRHKSHVARALTVSVAATLFAAGCGSGQSPKADAESSADSSTPATSSASPTLTSSAPPTSATAQVSRIKSIRDVYVYVEPCKSLAKSDAYFTSKSDVKSQFGIAKTGSPEWAEQQETFPLLTELPSKPTSATYCWILPKDEPEDNPETETILHVLEYPDIASAASATPGIIDGDPEAIGDGATIGAGDGWSAGSLRVDRVVLVLSVWDEKLNAIAATATVRSMLKDLIPTVRP